jgi:hypothetical protein
MRLFNHLITWRTDMPDQPDDITRLRKSHYALDELPETVSFPKHPSEPAREPLPVMEATVDDIAFAIIAAEQESSAAYRRSAALQRLYKIAREAGAIGTDRAAAAALKREKH